MDVFIGWSGEQSKDIAIEMHDWLPKIIQFIKPFMSEEDIEAGTNWSNVISKKLDITNFGILILTPNNLNKPWINFEAGALSKSLGKGRVCSVLFNLNKHDVEGPLSQFQLTVFNKDDIFKLIQSINESNEEYKLSIEILKDAFEVRWGEFKEHIDAIISFKSEKYKDSNKEKTERKTSFSNNKPMKLLDEILYSSKTHETLLKQIIDQTKVISNTTQSIHIIPKEKDLEFPEIITSSELNTQTKIRMKIKGNHSTILKGIQMLKTHPNIVDITIEHYDDKTHLLSVLINGGYNKVIRQFIRNVIRTFNLHLINEKIT